jgi:hypothetical protein
VFGVGKFFVPCYLYSPVSAFTPVKSHGEVAHENAPGKGFYLKPRSCVFLGRRVFAGDGFRQHP